MTEETISNCRPIRALSKQTLPWLLLFLLLQEDLVHQVGLGVQGGPDLPLVQSHQSVPKIKKQDMPSAVFILNNPTEVIIIIIIVITVLLT